MLNLDHVVFACADLNAGTAYLEKRLGVPLAPGGQHKGVGTYNRLLQLGGGTYLELIAPDPTQPMPAKARPFDLDRFAPAEPKLVNFVVNTSDIDSALSKLFYNIGPAITMQRDALQWRIAVPENGRLEMGGILPNVIQWPEGVHPANNLPQQGIVLRRLSICAPCATLDQLGAYFNDARLSFIERVAPGLGLELQTPAGILFF
jgi:hypothetical protein